MAVELERTAKPPGEYARILRWYGGALAYERVVWFVAAEAPHRRPADLIARERLDDFVAVGVAGHGAAPAAAPAPIPPDACVSPAAVATFAAWPPTASTSDAAADEAEVRGERRPDALPVPAGSDAAGQGPLSRPGAAAPSPLGTPAGPSC